MTVEQALNMISPVRLIVYASRVMFNTWDQEEANYWSAQGATVNPFYAKQGIEIPGVKKAKDGWEIDMAGACEPILVTKLTGDVEDVTRKELVKLARERREQAGV